MIWFGHLLVRPSLFFFLQRVNLSLGSASRIVSIVVRSRLKRLSTFILFIMYTFRFFMFRIVFVCVISIAVMCLLVLHDTVAITFLLFASFRLYTFLCIVFFSIHLLFLFHPWKLSLERRKKLSHRPRTTHTIWRKSRNSIEKKKWMSYFPFLLALSSNAHISVTYQQNKQTLARQEARLSECMYVRPKTIDLFASSNREDGSYTWNAFTNALLNMLAKKHVKRINEIH